MRIEEIKVLFQSEDTLDEVIVKLQEDIELVDEWSVNRKNGVVDNAEEIKRGLNELSGAYSNLRTVLALAESEKKNREVRFYNTRKIEIENAGEKFTSAAVDKEASAHVAEYRRVRNIIQAYTESAEKHIVTLQSNLKDEQRDYKNTQE